MVPTSTLTTRRAAAPWALLLALLAAFGVAGCTVQLAPNYEEPIVAALNDYNTAILTHMSSVSEGTQPGLTDRQKASYDALRARGGALIMLIRARPVPEPAFLRWFGKSVADRVAQDGDTASLAILEVPTDHQIEQILKQIDEMERIDRERGLASGQYRMFSNAVSVFMRNALTYEMALKR